MMESTTTDAAPRVQIYPQHTDCVSDFMRAPAPPPSPLISRLCLCACVRGCLRACANVCTCACVSHGRGKAGKYEREARRYWDLFYKRNGERVSACHVAHSHTRCRHHCARLVSPQHCILPPLLTAFPPTAKAPLAPYSALLSPFLPFPLPPGSSLPLAPRTPSPPSSPGLPHPPPPRAPRQFFKDRHYLHHEWALFLRGDTEAGGAAEVGAEGGTEGRAEGGGGEAGDGDAGAGAGIAGGGDGCGGGRGGSSPHSPVPCCPSTFPRHSSPLTANATPTPHPTPSHPLVLPPSSSCSPYSPCICPIPPPYSPIPPVLRHPPFASSVLRHPPCASPVLRHPPQVGCGAGNTVFPLLADDPHLFALACDFSSRAVALVTVRGGVGMGGHSGGKGEVWVHGGVSVWCWHVALLLTCTLCALMAAPSRPASLCRSLALPLHGSEHYDPHRLRAFVADITADPLATAITTASSSSNDGSSGGGGCTSCLPQCPAVCPPSQVDVVTMVFVLSAISPEKMPLAVANVATVLKPGGHVLVRDYAAGDLAQERLRRKEQRIADNFYVRGDGTRAYYFTEEALEALFAGAGMQCVNMGVCERTVTNRARQIDMHRRWIQAVFRLPLAAPASPSAPAAAATAATAAEDIGAGGMSDREGGEDERSGSGSSVVQGEGRGREGVGATEKSGREEGGREEGGTGGSDITCEVDCSSLFLSDPPLEDHVLSLAHLPLRVRLLSREHQHTQGSTGRLLWESSQVLAALLLAHPALTRHSSVLELGAGGAALCSLAATHSAPRVIVATDGDENALSLLPGNLELNAGSFETGRIKECRLRWGDEGDEAAVRQLLPSHDVIGADQGQVQEEGGGSTASTEGSDARTAPVGGSSMKGDDTEAAYTATQQGRGFDVILGADVVYVRAAVPLLFQSAARLLARRDGSGGRVPVLLLCHITRQVLEPDVLAAAAAAGLEVAEGEVAERVGGSVERAMQAAVGTAFPGEGRDASLFRLLCFRATSLP
ncbi:unnamed protein product [Closterium sp. Naga37s-1]|nr:unnamed protein product [Closterium sp. Naga37s-1]